MAKRTERTTNTTTTYSGIDELDNDLRPGKQPVKKVPSNIEATKRRTASVGETPVNPPVKGINDPQ